MNLFKRSINMRINPLYRSYSFKRNVPLYMMFAPVIIYFIVIKYIPMFGLTLAFREYNFVEGFFGSPWIGLKNFELLVNNPMTFNIVRNTFFLSLGTIIVGFPLPIIIALMLNEVRKKWIKKSVQTMIFLPHFFSWVIVGGLALTLFGQEVGIVNYVIKAISGESFPFLYRESSWIMIFLGSNVWKDAGFTAIIYLAALTSIDPHLYEAASMDGANKWKRTWHITLPGISTVIVLMLILSMGRVMEVGFDAVYVLQNQTVLSISEVISTYIFKVGLSGAQFSLGAAMGLFESLVGLVMVVISNQIARKYDQGLW